MMRRLSRCDGLAVLLGSPHFSRARRCCHQWHFTLLGLGFLGSWLPQEIGRLHLQLLDLQDTRAVLLSELMNRCRAWVGQVFPLTVEHFHLSFAFLQLRHQLVSEPNTLALCLQLAAHTNVSQELPHPLLSHILGCRCRCQRCATHSIHSKYVRAAALGSLLGDRFGSWLWRQGGTWRECANRWAHLWRSYASRGHACRHGCRWCPHWEGQTSTQSMPRLSSSKLLGLLLRQVTSSLNLLCCNQLF